VSSVDETGTTVFAFGKKVFDGRVGAARTEDKLLATGCIA